MPPGWMPGAVAPPAPPLHATGFEQIVEQPMLLFDSKWKGSEFQI